MPDQRWNGDHASGANGHPRAVEFDLASSFKNGVHLGTVLVVVAGGICDACDVQVHADAICSSQWAR